MQESWQTQPANPRGVSNLMDDEVTVCDICGDVGRVDFLAFCSNCTDGAEHTYCMHVMLDEVPEGDWMCEECTVRSECQKSGSPGNLESWPSSKLKFKSTHAWKRQTEGTSSTSHSPAKRHGVPSEAQPVEKNRVIRMSAETPRSSQPCYNAVLHRDLSCKKFKNGKAKSTKDITSKLRISCDSREKAKVPHACGDKRRAGTLEVELDGKRKVVKTRATFPKPKASKPSNQSLLSKEPQFKKLRKAKLETAHPVCSVKQSSYVSQENRKLPSRLGYESPKLDSQTEIARDKCSLLKSGTSKTADVKFKGKLAEGGCLQKHKVERNLAFHDIRKGENIGLVSKSVSFNSVSSVKLNATCSEVILANANCPVVFKNLSSVEETETTKGKYAPELRNPGTCLLATESGVIAGEKKNKTISRDETFISGYSCLRLDVVQSCGQLDCRLQPNSHNAHKGQHCLNEEKQNEIWQAERPSEAATAIKLHKLCTSLGSDEYSKFEAAILSKDFIIPKPDYIWLGKFQINRSKGIASTCDGIQAQLSTHASQKVIEVVDRLPDVIVLEELPRLRMWLTQFMESQATEENIALYFFAKDVYSYRTYYKGLIECMTKNDLALKGTLNGVELLIFPSNVLPEKSQRWNKLLFLWGVFRGCKINNSANTPLSNSQKRENRDIVSSGALDLNVYPEDGNDMGRVHEIGEFDSIGIRSSGDRILLGGDSYKSGCPNSSQSPDGKEKASKSAPDFDLSLRPESATLKDSPGLSVGNVSDKPDKDVKGKMPMEEKNNADIVGPSRPPSRSLVLPTVYEENLDLLQRQAAESLLLFSMEL